MNESGGNPIGPIGLIGPITLAVGPYGCFEAMHTYGSSPPQPAEKALSVKIRGNFMEDLVVSNIVCNFANIKQ